jgi:hypothetical protein
MPNSWFRLYAEFATDPKVQTLTEAMQRRFIMLMCLQCDGTLQKLSEKEIAYALGITENKLLKTFQNFFEKMLIYRDENNSEKIFITNWNKRQYVSDTSTDRVKKHRDKKANETFQERYGNATETAPDTDTDTDKIHIPESGDSGVQVKPAKRKKKVAVKHEYTPSFETFWNHYPRKVDKADAFEVWQEIDRLNITSPKTIIDAIQAQVSANMFDLSDDLKHCAHPTTWLNKHRWENEITKSTQRIGKQTPLFD